ncbi:MAG: flagellin [Clostridia bacterium]|nr:flagellin [Clostridia bacterium]
MVIAHNISALNTYKSLGIAGGSADKSMEKLSSGYKINKAADDAAGLSISEKMRSQIRGLNQASTNASNGVSMIQTAEGALNEEHSILQRMRELAVQSATDTNASEDREALQSEMAQLTNEINRIGATTEFNGMKILNGSKVKNEGGADNSVYFHVGANSNQVINTEFKDMQATALGISATAAKGVAMKVTIDGEEKTIAEADGDKYFVATANVNNGTSSNLAQYSLNISTREGANNAIQIIDSAIKKVSEERSKYGAIQNRLEYTINNLNTTAENMTAAESTVRDVDMASEMMEFTKNNILQQAAQAMLVQANSRPQQALQLLQ